MKSNLIDNIKSFHPLNSSFFITYLSAQGKFGLFTREKPHSHDITHLQHYLKVFHNLVLKLGAYAGNPVFWCQNEPEHLLKKSWKKLNGLDVDDPTDFYTSYYLFTSRIDIIHDAVTYLLLALTLYMAIYNTKYYHTLAVPLDPVLLLQRRQVPQMHQTPANRKYRIWYKKVRLSQISLPTLPTPILMAN